MVAAHSIKTKVQLAAAKVLMTSKDTGAVLEVERTVKAVRVGHMVAFSLPALELYGLHATVPKEPAKEGEYA